MFMNDENKRHGQAIRIGLPLKQGNGNRGMGMGMGMGMGTGNGERGIFKMGNL